jgi:hypothetical protein
MLQLWSGRALKLQLPSQGTMVARVELMEVLVAMEGIAVEVMVAMEETVVVIEDIVEAEVEVKIVPGPIWP